MRVFKCDGKRFSDGKQCVKETEYGSSQIGSEIEYPDHWITIRGKIVNSTNESHHLMSNCEHHFCSRQCLELFLFKDTK